MNEGQVFHEILDELRAIRELLEDADAQLQQGNGRTQGDGAEMIIERPNPNGARHQTPKRIIVHSMAEVISGLEAVDFLEKINLSAHALVTPDGHIIKCREDTQGAWHAKGFNTDSLGIEFLLPGEHDYASFLEGIEQPGWVSEEQLLAGARWIAEWMARWGITQIDGHSDVDPARKRDPGRGFPWDKLRAAL